MSGRRLLTALGLALLALTMIPFSGCAIGLGKSLQEYSLTDPPENYGQYRHRDIQASVTQNVVFATGDTDFADQAYQTLLDECPKGRIINVSARYATDLGFLAYKNTLRIRGICLE
jgi:hypothetical protein